MYFVRSGYIDLMYAALKGSGFASYLWSATAYAPELSDAFTFRFNATTINSSNSNGRFNAFSLPVYGYPMYFVRSGIIYIPLSSLRDAGDNGFFWSSVAYPADVRYAFDLSFSSTNASPSHSTNRYYGFSLRCHARYFQNKKQAQQASFSYVCLQVTDDTESAPRTSSIARFTHLES